MELTSALMLNISSNSIIGLAILHYGFWPMHWLLLFAVQWWRYPSKKKWLIYPVAKDVMVPDEFRDHPLYVFGGWLFMSAMFISFIAYLVLLGFNK